jgi:murein L,D-transpeptidase YcbB/YkuD
VKNLALRAAALTGATLTVIALAGCAAEADPVARAEAQVAAKEKAVSEAQTALTAASAAFCDTAKTYVLALDRYGDVLHDTAPTVGDVRAAGADLAEPQEDVFDAAEAATQAQQDLTDAEQELADAQAALEQAQTDPSVEPQAAEPVPTQTPLVPEASVERVKQAESEFADAQASITDETSLADAAEHFNSAAVALEFSWLKLFADAGCLGDEQTQQAVAVVSAYTSALQQELTDAGYYTGAVDGIYGPLTVAAVEALQEANGLPVTGTVDKATAEALQVELEALGGAAAQAEVASTAAVQQTLKLLGLWDGPVDGVWTPELTQALQALQVELGVEPTGTVDAATVTALQQAIAELTESTEPTPEPTPTP